MSEELENDKLKSLLELTNDEIKMVTAFKIDSEKEVNRLQLVIKDYSGQIAALNSVCAHIKEIIDD